MKTTFTMMARYFGELNDQSGFTVEIQAELPTIPAPGTRFAFAGPSEGERVFITATDVVFDVTDQCILVELAPEHVPDPDALYSFAKDNGGTVVRWTLGPADE